VVAAPAWARFMRAATEGASADWYPMPRDVEKVAICRLTGARASDACRHQSVAAVPTASGHPIASPPSGPAVNDLSEPHVDGQPPVYEDLFPLGVVPQEACTVHGVAASSLTFATRLRNP
jgi:hypothetical protein